MRRMVNSTCVYFSLCRYNRRNWTEHKTGAHQHTLRAHSIWCAHFKTTADQINWRQSPPINSSNCWTSEATAWNTSSDVNVWAEHWRMCVNDTTLTGWCRCSQNLQNLQTNKTQRESRTSSVMTGESEAVWSGFINVTCDTMSSGYITGDAENVRNSCKTQNHCRYGNSN